MNRLIIGYRKASITSKYLYNNSDNKTITYKEIIMLKHSKRFDIYNTNNNMAFYYQNIVHANLYYSWLTPGLLLRRYHIWRVRNHAIIILCDRCATNNTVSQQYSRRCNLCSLNSFDHITYSVAYFIKNVNRIFSDYYQTNRLILI